MAEPITDNALLQTKQAPAANDAGKSMMEIFREVEAEQAAPEAEAAPQNDVTEKPENDTKTAPERGEDGKFKKTEGKEEKKPEKKGIEGKSGRDEVGELAKARAKLRERAAAAEQREVELARKTEELNALIAEMESGKAPNVRKLAEDGDMDGLAKTLGFEDWNKLNEHYLRLKASPEYRRIRALEEDRAKEKAALEKFQRDAEQKRYSEEKQQQINEAYTQVTDALKTSENPVFAVMAEKDPHYAPEVFKRIYALVEKGEEPEEVFEQVAAEVAAAAMQKHALWAELTENHPELRALMGGRHTEKAEARSSANPTGQGRKPERKANKHVSTSTATEASEPLPENMTDDQWKKFFTKEMKNAMDEDIRNGVRF